MLYCKEHIGRLADGPGTVGKLRRAARALDDHFWGIHLTIESDLNF